WAVGTPSRRSRPPAWPTALPTCRPAAALRSSSWRGRPFLAWPRWTRKGASDDDDGADHPGDRRKLEDAQGAVRDAGVLPRLHGPLRAAVRQDRDLLSAGDLVAGGGRDCGRPARPGPGRTERLLGAEGR